MELTSVQCFLKGKTILVTGATGFLAKVFVEKLLRIQSDIKKLYLLIRASNNDEATQRLHEEMIRTELFRVLREKWDEEFDSLISEKVVAVAGDVCVANLGINDANLRSLILEETNIIVNSAATTSFDERFDIAVGTNTMGPLHVLNFAKSCPKLQIFLHISTAYVCGEAKEGEVIKEKAFEMGESLKGPSIVLDIEAEKCLMEKRIHQLHAHNAHTKLITSAMKDYGIERAKLYGWPNSYVFTKAMGEMIVSHYKLDKIPIIIIRPTMITSTYKEPFPGWIEGFRTLDSVIGGYGKGNINCFPGHPKTIIDVIPADMVINSMMAAMVIHAKKEKNSEKFIIYHVASSSANPLRLPYLNDVLYRYFKNKPCTDNTSGNPIIISKCSLLPTSNSFRTHMLIRYLLPLMVLNMANKVFCQMFQDVYNKNDRKVKMVMRMAELYEPYVYFKAVFDDTNTEKLRMATKMDEQIGFEPKSINWADYMTNVHIPGLLNYVLKKNSYPQNNPN